MSLVSAKNLILELTYSISHHIPELISRLCRITIKAQNDTVRYNPVVVCCAFWVVFAATRKFETYNFNSGSLETLVSTQYSIYHHHHHHGGPKAEGGAERMKER